MGWRGREKMYEGKIAVLKKMRTVASHIACLGKLLAPTEVPQLRKSLGDVLQSSHVLEQ